MTQGDLVKKQNPGVGRQSNLESSGITDMIERPSPDSCYVTTQKHQQPSRISRLLVKVPHAHVSEHEFFIKGSKNRTPWRTLSAFKQGFNNATHSLWAKYSVHSFL